MKIEKIRKLKVKERTKGEQHIHKIPSIVDLMHVLFAKEFGCKRFITFDQYFDEVKEHDIINPLEIEIRH